MMIPELTERYIDFIGFYENVYPHGWCQHMINEFDSYYERGFCGNRKEREGDHMSTLRKNDTSLFLDFRNHPNAFRRFEGEWPTDIFRNGLQRCFERYVAEYEGLKEIDIKCSSIKVQKTDPGQGYHIWHFEQGNADPGRILVYAVFLNTIEEAGETEFLYQKLRIPPKENTMIIWPASYTHTHRGNVVHGIESKYIITGWFHLG